MSQQNRRTLPKLAVLVSLSLLLAIPFAQAKWKTETFTLKAGWNSLYLFVDTSYESIEAALSDYPSIEEVWRWQPDGLTQRIITSPEAPVSGAEWAVWRRADSTNSTLTTLRPNFAYLVKVASSAADFNLNLKGQATLPRVVWRTDGVNLIGFPVSKTSPPDFGDFLDSSVLLASSEGIYEDQGGELSSSNPARILNPAVSEMERGNAYWINIGRYSRYYGPIRLEIMGGDGLQFSASNNSIQILATNISDDEATLSIEHLDSETPPASQQAITGKTPLLVRSFNEETGRFTYDPVTDALEANLSAGESKAWVFAVDRASMSGNPGDLFASLLKVSGVSGTEIYLPTSAEITSTGGLWIGDVLLDQVGSLVRTYQRFEDGQTEFDSEGQPQLNTDLTTPSDAEELPATAQQFPLRVIVHVDQDGKATLLSHAYVGQISNGDSPYEGIATSESLLDPDFLDSAVRLSVANLPVDTIRALSRDPFRAGATLTTELLTPFDDSSNPFVHAYHPDHDNRDARFENALEAGVESFTFSRKLSLAIDPDGDASSDPSWGSTLLTGEYEETITGIHKDDIRVRGRARLYRVSPLSTLHQQQPVSSQSLQTSFQ